MPKILLVANTDWYLYNFRMALAEFLRERGLEVAFVTPAGEFAPKIEEKGFRRVHWDVGRKSVAPWTELGAMRGLAEVYRREGPDLVHHHTMKPISYGTRAARRLGLPAVVNHVCGLGFVFSADTVRARAIRPFLKALLRRAARHPNCEWTFENEGDRSHLVAAGLVPADRTHVIESVGVDTERFRASPEPDGTPTILFCGRLLWDKGVGLLVEAARLVRQDTPVRVVLVGEPDPGNPGSVDEATLRRWVDDGDVEWPGFRLDVERAYADANVVALPSSYGEGVPTVLIEGAATGRALVAVDIPGSRAIVQDGRNGFLVPPDDPAALARALRRLVDDADLRGSLGAAGRRIVEERFDADEINRATLDVYERVLAGNAAS